MRLLSHLADGEERLAVAADDRDAIDAAYLVGDGPPEGPQTIPYLEPS